MKISLGFSPCPNDTFIFHGLVSGQLSVPGCDLQVCLHDVETLNQMAFEEALDISKLSFYAWLNVRDRYSLLNSGGALGYGCGPLVIARRPLNPRDIRHCRTVLPGQWTTAHLLFRLWAPEANDRVFVPYDRIFDALRQGHADCGVIIHESRFTYQQQGLHQIVDLGAWWESQAGLPIPLGCIAAHERLPVEARDAFERLVPMSIALARKNPEGALPYIREYAQEMTAEVLRAHIDTFVNDFSLDLGERGRAAVKALELRARAAGII